MTLGNLRANRYCSQKPFVRWELNATDPSFSPVARIHVHLDNASHHHAKRVREWLKQQGRKCVLHFIPPYCPHLDPIERCWGLMHQYTTHNRDYKTFDQFRAAILTFLNQTIPKKWSISATESTTTSASYHRPIFGLSLSQAISASSRKN